MGGQDSALALTESDLVAVALANASQNYGVAIKKEFALLAIGELDLLLASPAELKKRQRSDDKAKMPNHSRWWNDANVKEGI